MTSHDDQAPGVAPCHGCGSDVLFAVPDGQDGTVIALDPDERGGLAAFEDSAGTARCRPVAATYQLALGEFLFRYHDPACPALAPVVDLSARRAPVVPPARPAPARKHAHAR